MEVAKVIQTLLPFPVPASLLALSLLLLIFCVLGQVPPSMERVCQFLLSHLSLLFIPIIVSVALYGEAVREHLWLLGVALLLSTAVSLALTGWVAQKLEKQR